MRAGWSSRVSWALRKFFCDVWGDAVNVASRMESTDEAGKARLSEAVYRQLEEESELESRGLIDSKAKVKCPLGSWSGKKHCFLTPLISPISSGFSPLARFSRLAAAAFSMSPYGGSPDRSIQAAA